MRKYQQLLLIVISIISVTVLIVYRSENERLNNVLNVINIFGQRDSINLNLVKIENFSNFTVKFDFPLPTWSYLGNEFHGYSAFWRKNDLVAGGEVLALVSGSVHGNVLFQVKIVAQQLVVITLRLSFSVKFISMTTQSLVGNLDSCVLNRKFLTLTLQQRNF